MYNMPLILTINNKCQGHFNSVREEFIILDQKQLKD